MLAMRCKYDCMITAHGFQTQRISTLDLELCTPRCRAMCFFDIAKMKGVSA